MENKKKNLLIIFIKEPCAGQVKTRLQPELSKENTLDFYMAMVEDLIAQFSNGQSFDTVLFFSPAKAKQKLQKWLGSDLSFYPQKGRDLGMRMQNAFEWAFARGWKKAVLVGSDIPTLDLQTIEDAFTNLDNHDVVFGPSDAGGYYLIALKKLNKIYFHDIAWSTENVLSDSLEKALFAQRSVHLLAQKTDIDTFQDVLAFWHDLSNSDLLQQRLTNTFKMLGKILKRLAVSLLAAI